MLGRDEADTEGLDGSNGAGWGLPVEVLQRKLVCKDGLNSGEETGGISILDWESNRRSEQRVPQNAIRKAIGGWVSLPVTLLEPAWGEGSMMPEHYSGVKGPLAKGMPPDWPRKGEPNS